MGLTFGGNIPDEITYDGQPVDSVTYNGVEVWSGDVIPYVNIKPTGAAISNPFSQIKLTDQPNGAYDTGTMCVNDGNKIYGQISSDKHFTPAYSNVIYDIDNNTLELINDTNSFIYTSGKSFLSTLAHIKEGDKTFFVGGNGQYYGVYFDHTLKTWGLVDYHDFDGLFLISFLYKKDNHILFLGRSREDGDTGSSAHLAIIDVEVNNYAFVSVTRTLISNAWVTTGGVSDVAVYAKKKIYLPGDYTLNNSGLPGTSIIDLTTASITFTENAQTFGTDNIQLTKGRAFCKTSKTFLFSLDDKALVFFDPVALTFEDLNPTITSQLTESPFNYNKSKGNNTEIDDSTYIIISNWTRTTTTPATAGSTTFNVIKGELTYAP